MISPVLEIQKKQKVIQETKLVFRIEAKLNAYLLRRILDKYFENLDYLVVSAFDQASLYGGMLSILEYERQGYEHTFVMFETATTDQELLQEEIDYFKPDVKAYGMEDYVTYIPIRPHFQAWIRPKMKEYIEEKHDFLLYGIDPNDIPIDVEQMKKEVPDFKKFVEQIETFLKPKTAK